MLDEQQIQEAIGIPKVGVSVVHGEGGEPTTIVAGIKISGRVGISYALIQHAHTVGESALGTTIACKLRDEILHELFTILEEANAPDLQMIKSMAWREGITGVVYP